MGTGHGGHSSLQNSVLCGSSDSISKDNAGGDINNASESLRPMVLSCLSSGFHLKLCNWGGGDHRKQLSITKGSAVFMMG